MADTAISALTVATAAAGSMELPVSDAAGVSNKKLTVDMLAKYVGWKNLGEQILGSAAARTGDVIWTGDYKVIVFQYLIPGYAGGAIGRVIVGSGSLSETATDCSCELTEAGTRNTSSVSVCGWPTAVTANTNRRWGEFRMNNVTGSSVRDAYGRGGHGGSATTVPSGMTMVGFKAAVGQIDRARLTSFTGPTGNTVGSNLNAGTFLRVMGLPA